MCCNVCSDAPVTPVLFSDLVPVLAYLSDSDVRNDFRSCVDAFRKSNACPLSACIVLDEYARAISSDANKSDATVADFVIADYMRAILTNYGFDCKQPYTYDDLITPDACNTVVGNILTYEFGADDCSSAVHCAITCVLAFFATLHVRNAVFDASVTLSADYTEYSDDAYYNVGSFLSSAARYGLGNDDDYDDFCSEVVAYDVDSGAADVIAVASAWYSKHAAGL